MTAALEFRRSDGASLVYERQDARDTQKPTVVFLHGLRSDKGGTKAEALTRHAHSHGYGLLRFDMFGHGASSGRFEDGGISRWVEDAVAVLDGLTKGPVVLVGSSMGGWVMVKTAMARPERVNGLVGIAVAPDFTEDLMWAGFDAAQRHALHTQGAVELPSEYDDGPYRISRHLIEDGRKNLVLRDAVNIGCPVRLIHGQKDTAVPWQTSLRLAERITGDDVAVQLVKDGDHRLSRPQDLERLCGFVEELVGKG
ncbi:MAG: alpha/beta hydrolase [Proteobacteria bacterium]|nr:alpha/beta hydrolase [Pseudomonadota bacterium]